MKTSLRLRELIELYQYNVGRPPEYAYVGTDVLQALEREATQVELQLETFSVNYPDKKTAPCLKWAVHKDEPRRMFEGVPVLVVGGDIKHMRVC